MEFATLEEAQSWKAKLEGPDRPGIIAPNQEFVIQEIEISSTLLHYLVLSVRTCKCGKEFRTAPDIGRFEECPDCKKEHRDHIRRDAEEFSTQNYTDAKPHAICPDCGGHMERDGGYYYCERCEG